VKYVDFGSVGARVGFGTCFDAALSAVVVAGGVAQGLVHVQDQNSARVRAGQRMTRQ
jgi:hypothetical protein